MVEDWTKVEPEYARVLYSAVERGLDEAALAGELIMLDRVRASLRARARGESEGGDVEIMAAVDAIVIRESADRVAKTQDLLKSLGKYCPGAVLSVDEVHKLANNAWAGYRPPARGAVQPDAFGTPGSGLTDTPPAPKSGLDSLTPDLNRVRPGGPGPVEVHSWWCPVCGAHTRTSNSNPVCPWVPCRSHGMGNVAPLSAMRRQENPTPVYDEVGPGAEVPQSELSSPCAFCTGTGLGASERESCQMCGGSGEQTEVTV